MKLKNSLIALVVIALGASAEGAVTVSVKNFTSTTVGIPIVDTSGAAIPAASINASAGIFTTLPNFTTATASQILAAFTALDATPVAGNAFGGLFSANDMLNGAYPANFSGANAYILVGNNATLASSTAIAVYASGSTFTPVDGLGNANVALAGTTAANWVYGTERSVTTQPTLTNAAYTTGVELISSPAPEPSAALLGSLGLLGLLRRRR